MMNKYEQKNVLVVKELQKNFDGVAALRAVSLTVKEGEIFGLLGPDGAGKTTLMRIILGIMAGWQGNMEILGASNISQCKNKIGYIPQKFSLYTDLTVWENISLLSALYGADKKTTHAKGEEVLKFTNLLRFKDRLAGNLSGGMKQKLALASGLLHKPQILFLDEPTTGVDPVSRREFWQILYRLNREGTTIFVSTPYMDEAELCSKIAFLHEGIIVASGTPSELRQGAVSLEDVFVKYATAGSA